LRIIKNTVKDSEIVLYGEDINSQSVPFEYRANGIISDPNKLAELYSRSDIFLDSSDFQGFGRASLEAMACGTACVVTGVGGVTEYARDGYNCSVVPPRDPERMAGAVITLLYDAELRNTISRGGLETASRFDHKREARETRSYFEGLVVTL
jgi:glycosyltransferase involved in cell wall biosynthesis